MEHDGTLRSPWISPSPCGPCGGPPHTLAKDRPKARPMMLAWRPRRVPFRLRRKGTETAGEFPLQSMGKSWENMGKTNMGKWENHRKILGKLWEKIMGKILGTSRTSAYKMEVLMGKPSRNDSFSIAMFDYRRTIHRIAFWLYQPSYELYTVYIFTGSLKPSISYCSTYV